jgi:hypothetical protein
MIYKMGIKEPQLAPSVSTSNSTVSFGGGTGNLLVTAIPWTNNPIGTNNDFNYGETDGYPHTDPTTPMDGTKWYSVDVQNASYVTISSLVPNGTVIINGDTITTQAELGDISSPSAHTRVGSGVPGYPGQFLQTLGSPTNPSVASYVIGAFVDSSGDVMAAGVAPLYIPSVVDIGANIGVEITVPSGAVALQIGMNSVGNTYSSNSGSIGGGEITISGTITTNALPSVTSLLGSLTAYYWGDSPNAGPVDQYIWKNPDDPGGSGPTRSTSSADGSTSGNSLIFDATFTKGIPALPGIGTEDSEMQWFQLNSESVVTGEYPVFSAPITTKYTNNKEYNNFNFCLTGNIYFPAYGDYTFILTSHDNMIWGIGGGAKSSTSGIKSTQGQTITVVGGYPLLPINRESTGEDGDYQTTTVVVSIPSAGTYPIEVDYDYWYNKGRILLITASPKPGESPTIIPPTSSNIRQQVQYRYCYRSSATGAQSNPSPESTAESIPVLANTVTSLWSNDPQVDVVDYYRLDSVTSEFTYVATGPNDDLGATPGTNTPISDSLLDTELGTKTLDYDNYEPFPSIDLPQRGVCDVSGGVITWTSGGDIGGSEVGFSPRWLAGTKILIGSPTSLSYTFIARPTAASFQNSYLYPLNFFILDSAGHYQLVTVSGTSQAIGTPTFSESGGTTISGGASFVDKGIYLPTGYVTEVTIPGVPDASGVSYEIPEPILAAQPLPYMWGPTDNVNYAFAVGDPLRPGTLYWSKGSNLDSAPDTNQQDVTDPSEPLVNGVISVGLGVLLSIKRGWLIMPNFSSATATATGTIGSTWTLQESSITRGLYMPRCLCVSGGGNIFFRVTDGIHVSSYGSASKSITDDDIYPLFPHENQDGGTSIPQPVTIAGYTIYPPDDSEPQSQRMYSIGSYVYYDYIGTDGVAHTLVFDEAAMGWVYDLYTPPVTVHAANDGQSIQGVLAGCSDGLIRQLASAAGAAPSPVTTQLGSAANYALLAYSGITNSGSSVISGGNIGSFPTASITGFPPGLLTSPAIIDNANASAAQTALTAAIVYYQGLTATISGLGNLSTGGNGSTASTYTPGVYVGSTSLTMPTGIILDAQGNPNAQFVFVAGSTINLASGQTVSLINGATAANVVFVAGSSFTSVATSTMNGNILAVASVTLGGGILNGRALANNGAVTIAASTTVTVASAVPGGGTEVATAVYLTPAFDKGDTRATANFGDIYVESTNP